MKLAALVALASLAPLSLAQEYSIIPDSTVIGRNYGYPTGTPTPDDADNPLGRTPVHKLDLVTEAAVFFKNLEITGFPESDRIDGQTFFGFLSPLRLRYRAAEEVTIEAGAVLGHDFGDEDALDIAEPLVRLVYEPTPSVFLVGGTLLRTHWIHDALLNDVQAFRENAEQGLQARVDWKHWKQDTWINWRVREDAFTAEEFEVGNASQLRYAGFRADGQMLWAHVGGQLNSADRVENNVIFAGGGSWGTNGTDLLEDVKWIDDARFSGMYFFSRDNTRSDDSGSGWELRFNIDTRPRENWLLTFFASYFQGDNFSNWRGDMLYRIDDYTQIGASSFWRLPGGLRAEAMAVLQQTDDRTNYSFAINLVWGKAWNLPVGE